jgi:hypothetical protein
LSARSAGGFSITVNDPSAPALVPDVVEMYEIKATQTISASGIYRET